MATQGQALNLEGTKTTFAARLARLYVYSLLIVEVLLFAASTALHITVVMGNTKPYLKLGLPLAAAAFISIIAVGSLAADRDLRFEFKTSPVWLQDFTIASVAYGVLAAFLAATLNSVSAAFDTEAFAVSAFPLIPAAAAFCTLSSVLWSAPLSQSELIERARNSVITTAVATLLLYARIHFQFPVHRPDTDLSPLPRNPL